MSSCCRQPRWPALHPCLAAIILVSVLGAVTGCERGLVGGLTLGVRNAWVLNTLVKQYLDVETDEFPEASVDHYKIDVFIQAARSRSLAGTDSFRVTISTAYTEEVAHAKDVKAIPALMIDSLALDGVWGCNATFYPTVAATNAVELLTNPVVRSKHLDAPDYLYSLIVIPSDCMGVRLSYIARLVDRQTGEEIRSERVVRRLWRTTSLKYYP